MNPDGGPPIGLIMYAIGVPFLAVMCIFGMWFALQAFKARTRQLADAQYKALAESTAVTQAETAASLSIVKAQLADVAASLAAVHKILKQVD
jgi:hypothetical protein